MHPVPVPLLILIFAMPPMIALGYIRQLDIMYRAFWKHKKVKRKPGPSPFFRDRNIRRWNLASVLVQEAWIAFVLLRGFEADIPFWIISIACAAGSIAAIIMAGIAAHHVYWSALPKSEQKVWWKSW